jgi:formate-dependent nitrite reductase membrane component NrfD
MKPVLARTLLLIVAAIGLIVGLLAIGSANQYEANLGEGLFTIGGVAIVAYLALIASREHR